MLEALRVLFGRRAPGQALVEYGLILVLVAIAVILVLTALGGQLQNVFNQIVSALGGTAP